MKKHVVALLVMVCLVPVIFAEESNFKYDSSKMDVGSMYSYSIKELNGDKQMKFYFYVQDPQTILTYADFTTVVPLIMVINGKFDTKYCCFTKTEGYNPFAYLKMPGNDVSIVNYNVEKKTIDATVTYFDDKGNSKKISMRKQMAMAPTYEMSLYQLDFWFAMRFNTGKTKFNVGSFYNGAVAASDVTYKGEEVIDGILCDKWEVAQQGILAKLAKQKQTFWFDKTDSFYKVLRYENTVNVSPVGQLHIRFMERKSCSIDEWNSFVEQKNEEARVRLGFKKK